MAKLTIKRVNSHEMLFDIEGFRSIYSRNREIGFSFWPRYPAKDGYYVEDGSLWRIDFINANLDQSGLGR